MKPEPENLILANDEPPASGTAKGVGSVPWLGGLEATCEDCMALMARYPDKHFDLAIVDPPYGIGNWSAGAGANSLTPEEAKKINGWDARAPNAEYFAELRRVSRDQIVWGGNYFLEHLGNCLHVVVWDKKNRRMHLADGEMAWTSMRGTAMRIFEHHLGFDSKGGNRIHPTQKPVALYDWLLANYAKPGQRILDTHLGSGSHAIAAHYFGAHLTACEIDADYYAAAMARIKRETAQTTLFA